MILVTGGTGVVGSRVVEMLLDMDQQVRILARGQSDWRDNPMPQFRRMGADVISGDLRDNDKLAAAVTGATAIVHCGNIMRAQRGESLQAVNVDSFINLVALAEGAGVQRLIYVGCLGASQYSTSLYYQTKWHAEQVVRTSRFYWTIFKPNIIFAPGSILMRALEFWTSKLPVVPVVGSGLNRIQPVSADDVATCIVKSIYDRETVGQTYDLVGPKSYNLTELLEFAALHYSDRPKQTIKVPAELGITVAKWIGSMYPRAPMNEEVMKVLTTEVEGSAALAMQKFPMSNKQLESSFRRIAGR